MATNVKNNSVNNVVENAANIIIKKFKTDMFGESLNLKEVKSKIQYYIKWLLANVEGTTTDAVWKNFIDYLYYTLSVDEIYAEYFNSYIPADDKKFILSEINKIINERKKNYIEELMNKIEERVAHRIAGSFDEYIENIDIEEFDDPDSDICNLDDYAGMYISDYYDYCPYWDYKDISDDNSYKFSEEEFNEIFNEYGKEKFWNKVSEIVTNDYEDSAC